MAENTELMTVDNICNRVYVIRLVIRNSYSVDDW